MSLIKQSVEISKLFDEESNRNVPAISTDRFRNIFVSYLLDRDAILIPGVRKYLILKFIQVHLHKYIKWMREFILLGKKRDFQGHCCLLFLQFAQFSLPKAKASFIFVVLVRSPKFSRDVSRHSLYHPNNSSTWVDIYRILSPSLFSKLKSFLKIVVHC